MAKLENEKEVDVDYITQKWAILSIFGVGITIAGIVVIFTRNFPFQVISFDLLLLIFLLCDYFFIKAGFPLQYSFVILYVYTILYFHKFITLQLYLGIIILAHGIIISIYGFVRVYQLNKHFWSELLDKFEI